MFSILIGRSRKGKGRASPPLTSAAPLPPRVSTHGGNFYPRCYRRRTTRQECFSLRKERRMCIRSSLGLIINGAILAFAVSDSIARGDLTLIGYILMGGGARGVVISLLLIARRSTTTVQQSDPGGVSEHRPN